MNAENPERLMEADGWEFEFVCSKRSINEWLEIPPWKTVCCTESDINSDYCIVWSKD